MEASELAIFRALLSDVYARGTGGGILPVPLPESEAKTLAQILEETVHRTISEKTLRNYVRQAFGSEEHISPPNPSPFHLETLTRYALGLDGNNKNGDNGGAPTWFKYRQIWREHQEQKVIGNEVELLSLLRSRKWLWRGAALLLLLAIAVATWQWFNRPKYWEEPFDDVSVEGLKSRGWEILDYDSVAFSRQERPGCLTAYTYPGGYWVKKDSGETPMIKNMVVKRIGFQNCTITSRLVGAFDPNQNWQGAGVCIYGSSLSFDDNLSVFFSYEKYTGNEDSVKHYQKVQAMLLVNGKCWEKPWHIRLMNIDPHPFKEVEFELEVRKKHLSIGFRTDANWRSASLEKLELDLPFSPAYVGLGASQGHTDSFGKPLGADTIPAFFDYLKVEPLPE